MRFPPLLVLLGIAVLAPSGPLAPQVVRGTVTEGATGSPIPGAFIGLLAEDGARYGAVLTDDAGSFILRAPFPGHFTLQAERIGFATTASPLLDLHAGAAREYQFRMVVKAVDLEGIQVRGRGRCHVPREEGAITSLLWEEARKSLEVVAWLEGEEGIPYQTYLFKRTRDAMDLEVRESEGRIWSGFGKSPFRSRPPEELANEGYVRLAGDGTYDYFGLDAPTMLSDAFLNTHCFRLRSPPSAEGELIGLGFEPLPGHVSPDVEGVLWLDRKSSEIRRLEFTFTRHLYPVSVPPGPFGGRTDFRKLDNGAWIPERWWIRMPQYPANILPGSVNAGVQPAEGTRDRLLAAVRQGLRTREEGGEVLLMGVPGGSDAGGKGRLVGTVYDSIRSRPLEGATVFLLDLPRAARTDFAGRFRLTDLPAGTHQIAFFHPFTDSLGLVASPQRVQVDEGGAGSVKLAVSPAQGCPVGGRTGALVGFVEDEETGERRAGVQVTARWRGESTTRFAATGGEGREEGTTDANGRFRLCRLPVGVEVRVEAEGADRLELTLDGPRLLFHTFIAGR